MKITNQIKVVGVDPSLRNWGMASGTYTPETGGISIDRLELINPVLPTGKQVRQNSTDLVAATQLYTRSLAMLQSAQAIFVEVPVGSQNARAMASYGICVGVLGALLAEGFPIFEVTPTEVKLAGPGNKTANKSEMFNWAVSKYPSADWPTFTKSGQTKVTDSKAEHLADAIAAIHAGVNSTQFKQVISLMR